MRWKLKEKKQLLKSIPFNVEELHFQEGHEATHPWTRLECPDWVNVLPVTTSGEVILIRQMRVGCMRMCLEIPGGAVEPEEMKDPTLAAARELEEETGYVAESLLGLGSCNPNPAINTNRVHFFLARGCRPAEDREKFPDPGEDIELVMTESHRLESMVRFGEINHGLSALCVFMAGKYVNIS